MRTDVSCLAGKMFKKYKSGFSPVWQDLSGQETHMSSLVEPYLSFGTFDSFLAAVGRNGVYKCCSG